MENGQPDPGYKECNLQTCGEDQCRPSANLLFLL